MKKTFSVLTILAMSIGLFSCEKDSSLEETQSLYQDIDEQLMSTDDDDDEGARRDGIKTGTPL